MARPGAPAETKGTERMRARIVRIVLALALLLVLVGQPFSSLLGNTSTPVAHAAPGTLTVNPASGSPGAQVSITVSQSTFTPSTAVTVTFTDNSGNVSQTIANGTSDANGGFTANSVTLPSDATVGNAQVKAAGSGSPGTATGTFTVVPTLNVSPSHAPVNTTLSINIIGKGFGASDTVNFSIGGTQIGATATTSPAGSFNTNINVSTGANVGTISITATDAKATQTFQFTVDAASGSTATMTPTQTPTGTITPI